MATVPTAYTWSVGELMTAAKMNSYLRDLASFLLSRPYASLTHNTTQSITNVTDTPVNFNTELADTDGGHSTSTNTSRYTAQTAGLWDVSACVPWEINGTGKREAYLKVNNTTYYGSDTATAAASSRVSAAPAALIPVSVGDYIEVQVYQNSGGALNIDNTFRGGQKLDLIWERT